MKKTKLKIHWGSTIFGFVLWVVYGIFFSINWQTHRFNILSMVVFIIVTKTVGISYWCFLHRRDEKESWENGYE